MNTISGMSNLLQAQFACKSAKIAQNTKTSMSNEKDQINTEIALDGHSTAAKDNRLSQISSQSQKIDNQYSDDLKAAQTQTQKATGTQQDSSTASVSSDDTGNGASTTAINGTVSSADSTNAIATQTPTVTIVSENGTVILSNGTNKLDVRI